MAATEGVVPAIECTIAIHSAGLTGMPSMPWRGTPRAGSPRRVLDKISLAQNIILYILLIFIRGHHFNQSEYRNISSTAVFLHGTVGTCIPAPW